MTITKKPDRITELRKRIGFPADAGWWMRLLLIFALPAMLIWRHQVGSRMVSLFRLLALSGFTFVWGAVASAIVGFGDWDLIVNLFSAVCAFEFAVATLGTAHRITRWVMYQKGEMLSTRCPGISHFSKVIPNANAERYLDPLLTIAAGVVLCLPALPLQCHAPGSWLVLSGIALFAIESYMHGIQLDQVDGLLKAEAHEQATERFYQQKGEPASPSSSPTTVATGLGQDLQASIARRLQSRAVPATADAAQAGTNAMPPHVIQVHESGPETGSGDAPSAGLNAENAPAEGAASRPAGALRVDGRPQAAPQQPGEQNGPPPASAPQAEPARMERADVSPAWQERFRLIEKAGGTKLPDFRKLSFGERMKVNFNALAFLCGPFFYVANGMWKPGLVLLAGGLAIFDGAALVVPALNDYANLFGCVLGGLYASRASIDYYKKVVLGETGWGYPGGPLWLGAAVLVLGLTVARELDWHDARESLASIVAPGARGPASTTPKLSASADDGSAELEPAYNYYDGLKGYPQDRKAAASLFLKAAAKGNGAAEFALAVMVQAGEGGLAKSDEAAAVWLGKAASRGLPLAQARLGALYEMGRGVPADEQRAVALYRQAAEGGSAQGQLSLGSLYEQGKAGLIADPTTAAEWYRKSAEQNNARAQTYLGDMYLHGTGVVYDAAKAAHWYGRAAEQGEAAAQEALGSMYATAEGVDADNQRALYWYRKAAGQGFGRAERHLGFAYQHSYLGLKPNKVEALAWYRRAVEHGYDGAQKDVAALTAQTR